ncbi:hypothetical protein, partial [Acinetobacter baumannii]|uniref:hypothetical protein n=1 Tax=Acinetobacter baumannii TaxID=470 RepID=UPI001C074C89
PSRWEISSDAPSGDGRGLRMVLHRCYHSSTKDDDAAAGAVDDDDDGGDVAGAVAAADAAVADAAAFALSSFRPAAAVEASRAAAG